MGLRGPGDDDCRHWILKSWKGQSKTMLMIKLSVKWSRRSQLSSYPEPWETYSILKWLLLLSIMGLLFMNNWKKQTIRNKWILSEIWLTDFLKIPGAMRYLYEYFPKRDSWMYFMVGSRFVIHPITPSCPLFSFLSFFSYSVQ